MENDNVQRDKFESTGIILRVPQHFRAIFLPVSGAMLIFIIAPAASFVPTIGSIVSCAIRLLRVRRWIAGMLRRGFAAARIINIPVVAINMHVSPSSSSRCRGLLLLWMSRRRLRVHCPWHVTLPRQWYGSRLHCGFWYFFLNRIRRRRRTPSHTSSLDQREGYVLATIFCPKRGCLHGPRDFHHTSARSRGPMVWRSCAATSEVVSIEAAAHQCKVQRHQGRMGSTEVFSVVVQ